ncbi:uncharacterized protein LTR77_000750 [Saxophila tyrrhenica]|uniref:Cytochrome P450 monooxygenase n=1 Tax=Saxophila tyrrhenica TaxID=1690608 RepID=A0AAV9PPE9_9PEZI|nr:hypothetical protein LTR77_000750 [Saxophila tyrrhenica]
MAAIYGTLFGTTTVLLLLLLLPVYVAGYVVYQLRFHPLARYPGPVLGRVTKLHDLYHAYKGDKHVTLYQLHRKYGTIVRFSPNTLSINDSAALKAIYSHGANVEKGELYKCFRAAPNAVSTLLATEKDQHARKRRVMGQAFSDQALRGLEQYVQEHVQKLVDKVGGTVAQPVKDGKGWSGPVDMRSWCNWVVFDIMGDLVFGKSFGTLGEKPENREGIRLLGRAARRNYTVAAMPELLHYKLERWLPPFRGLYQDRAKYLAFGKKQVMARLKDQADGVTEAGRKDIFSFLLSAKDPETGEGFPMPEIMMEGNTLIVAGSDTSSTTLAATLYYLTSNLQTLHRLQKEIRDTFSSPDHIRHGPQLQSCTYLRACIDESMRMTPAVPGLLPRVVLPGGLQIPALGLDLPAGINVGCCIYALHHHEDYVVDSFTYDPSRWLKGEGHKQDKEALQAVFNPFSIGNRSCLGKPLVYMELGVAIARLVWEFDLRLAGEQFVDAGIRREVEEGRRRREEYQVQDWFLSNNFGPWVEFRKREGLVDVS